LDEKKRKKQERLEQEERERDLRVEELKRFRETEIKRLEDLEHQRMRKYGLMSPKSQEDLVMQQMPPVSDDLKSLIMNVVNCGKTIADMLNSDSPKDFDKKVYSNAVNQLVRTLSFGVSHIPGSEGKTTVRELTKMFLNESNVFLFDLNRGLQQGMTTDDFEECAEDVKDTLMNILTALKQADQLGFVPPILTKEEVLKRRNSTRKTRSSSFKTPSSEEQLLSAKEQFIDDVRETGLKIVALLKRPEFDGETFASQVEDFVVKVRNGRSYFPNSVEMVNMLKRLAKRGIELTRDEGMEPAKGEFVKALFVIVKAVQSMHQQGDD
jgi:hypothetical protein